MTEGKMIQMIPERPETPSLQLNGERGFVFSAGGKYRRIIEVRSLLCYWAVRELGVSLSSPSRKLGISVPSVSDSVARGQRLVEEGHVVL